MARPDDHSEAATLGGPGGGPCRSRTAATWAPKWSSVIIAERRSALAGNRVGPVPTDEDGADGLSLHVGGGADHDAGRPVDFKSRTHRQGMQVRYAMKRTLPGQQHRQKVAPFRQRLIDHRLTRQPAGDGRGVGDIIAQQSRAGQPGHSVMDHRKPHTRRAGRAFQHGLQQLVDQPVGGCELAQFRLHERLHLNAMAFGPVGVAVEKGRPQAAQETAFLVDLEQGVAAGHANRHEHRRKDLPYRGPPQFDEQGQEALKHGQQFEHAVENFP